MAVKLPNIDPRWSDKLSRSGFFFGALLLHLIIFLMVATWIIFPAFKPPTDDFEKTYLPSGAPPPPPQTAVAPMSVPTHSIAPPAAVINSASPAPAAFNIPMPDLSPAAASSDTSSKMTAPAVKVVNNLAARLPTIRATVTGWGRDADNIRNSHGDPHNVVAKFPVFVASYADGDWDCNLHLDADGKIDAGSIPNLVEKINQWSHGNIKAQVMTTPLDIGGPDLLDKKPPFIFFTGHKDFVLNDAEIKNLQTYLQDGGAIWGDNALAGEGSRFDVAFRREMKRVIPDIDKNFQPMDVSYDVFTKSWFPLTKVPQGMNYYAETILRIDIDGKLAVIYTPNDYSDMLQMHILPGDTEADPKSEAYPGHPLYTPGFLYYYSDTFFRNFQLPSALDANRLGMNIVAYLLVRFDDSLLLTP